MRRKRHKNARPTGDATARYERLSHSGSTWHDLMPVPADGTDGGTPGFWPGFDGVSWVTIGQPAKLNFADAFTVVAWANQNIDPIRQGKERAISRDNIANRNYIVECQDDTGIVSGLIWSPLLHQTHSPASFNTGTFHFIAFVNEGTGGDAKVYVDGALQATTVAAGGPLPNSPVDLEIGRPQSGAADYFTGAIDTGRFYSRALSPDEILRDYNAGKPAHI